jgi:hypothetical protein
MLSTIILKNKKIILEPQYWIIWFVMAFVNSSIK